MDGIYVVIAEDGHGSANGEAALVAVTIDEAKGFVADPPEIWRGHVRWPYGLAVYEAHRLDEDDLR